MRKVSLEKIIQLTDGRQAINLRRLGKCLQNRQIEAVIKPKVNLEWLLCRLD